MIIKTHIDLKDLASINVNLKNLTSEDKVLLFNLLEKAKEKQKLSKVADGETFKIGGIEFIKFSDIDGVTTAVTKDIVFKSDFGKNNNLANMKIIDRLNDEFLPQIIDEVGAENVLNVETALTTLDGVKTHGNITSKVSLPTLDFYRENVEIFDKYKVDDWWWLATPWSALPHQNSSGILCVSSSCYLCYDGCNVDNGVRLLLHFSSSIFVPDKGVQQ